MIPVLLFMVLLNAAEVKSDCYSKSLYATTGKKYIQYFHYSNNDDCVMSIIPSLFYRSGYYLELKWTSFDIEGSMPTCTDYIEVFLTSHYKTIGRYCSGNSATATLFNMYSSDGYAKLRFKSDGSITKGGFKFSYQLKHIQSNYIGRYGDKTCFYKRESPYYGIFYGSGWPRGYAAGSCYHAIAVPNGKEIRIAVMDLDLTNKRITCDDTNDNFHIRASNTLFGTIQSTLRYAMVVTKRHCGIFHPGYFTTTYNYVYLIVNKPFGSYPFYSNGGFMMGYIIYDAPRGTNTNRNDQSGSNKGSSGSGASRVGAIAAVLSMLLCCVIGFMY